MRSSDLDDMWHKYNDKYEFNYQMVQDFVDQHGQRLKYLKGEQLVEAGDETRYVYFIVQGVVSGKKIYLDGSEYSYFEVDNQRGNIGLLELLAMENQYVVTVHCLTPVEVVRIDYKILYPKLMEDVYLLRSCLKLVANDLYNLSHREGRFFHLKGIDRIRLSFMNYYEHISKHHETIVLEHKTQKDLAMQIGLSVRTVSRSLKIMTDNHEIQVLGRKIKITPQNYQMMIQQINNL